MSERDDDLELQALQRELDDAFATTRPRRDFEDELWLRMQAARPATNRLRDAIAGLLQGIREVPAVPAAAVATLLVVILGVGLLAAVHPRLGGGGGAATSNYNAEQSTRGAGADMAAVAFGRLPSPVFGDGTKTSQPVAPTFTGDEYFGPAQFVWSGRLTVSTASARVYRYREPSTTDADQFASALGAVLRERPEGLLGSYSAATYNLNIRPTVQRPLSSPTYYVISSASMPPVDAAGASPADVATIFLSQHSLYPDWANAVMFTTTGDPIRVVFQRQFEVAAGTPSAFLVDANGDRYGIEVDLQGNRPILVAGMLPVRMDAAEYPIVSPDVAVQTLTSARPNDSPSTPPVAQLTQAELVYVLVAAGDHSFYEPAYLFSGKVQVGGKMYTKRILVAAVDPSQRNP